MSHRESRSKYGFSPALWKSSLIIMVKVPTLRMSPLKASKYRSSATVGHGMAVGLGVGLGVEVDATALGVGETAPEIGTVGLEGAPSVPPMVAKTTTAKETMRRMNTVIPH